METGKSTLYRKPKIDFNPDNYESNQVFYTSKGWHQSTNDHHTQKGLKLMKIQPFFYGYGGFNISLTPSFSITNAVWMEQGGIYAVPNLREVEIW